MSDRGLTTAMSVGETFAPEIRTIEKPFGRALVKLGRQRGDIIGLTADLGKYTDIDLFGQAFPDRYFQIGMAEQNLVGIAAGLSRTGFVPFATTYCVFATRRAYDFIAIDMAYGRANVKIAAGLPGLTTGYGATHQGIDDLALMRSMPNMVVIDPCDATEIEQAVPAIAEYNGPVYIRMLRGAVKVVLDPDSYRFEIGKARLLRNGRDLVLISTGLMTERALEAATQLATQGVHASVMHVPTVKPLDTETILETVSSTKRVLTIENHSVVNGLGTAVAELLAEAGLAVRLRKLGIPDRFIECGSVPHLNEKYGLSTGGVVNAALNLLGDIKMTAQDISL
jgi:transketolase